MLQGSVDVTELRFYFYGRKAMSKKIVAPKTMYRKIILPRNTEEDIKRRIANLQEHIKKAEEFSRYTSCQNYERKGKVFETLMFCAMFACLFLYAFKCVFWRHSVVSLIFAVLSIVCLVCFVVFSIITIKCSKKAFAVRCETEKVYQRHFCWGHELFGEVRFEFWEDLNSLYEIADRLRDKDTFVSVEMSSDILSPNAVILTLHSSVQVKKYEISFHRDSDLDILFHRNSDSDVLFADEPALDFSYIDRYAESIDCFETATCHACGALYAASAMVCPSCNTEME